VAPFFGGGGAYAHILGSENTNDTSSVVADVDTSPASYWAGIAEAGIRFSTGNRFYELLGRHVWSSVDRHDSAYWTLRLAIGLSPTGG
jgi:hypothetical protein